MSLPTVYTTAEVAAALRCSTRFVTNQVRRGAVTPMRLGTRPNAPMRFTDEHVDQLRAAMTRPVRPARARKIRGAA